MGQLGYHVSWITYVSSAAYPEQVLMMLGPRLSFTRLLSQWCGRAALRLSSTLQLGHQHEDLLLLFQLVNSDFDCPTLLSVLSSIVSYPEETAQGQMKSDRMFNKRQLGLLWMLNKCIILIKKANTGEKQPPYLTAIILKINKTYNFSDLSWSIEIEGLTPN